MADLTPEERKVLQKLIQSGKIKDLVEEDGSEAPNHFCPSCEHEFYSEKNRRKCPECKKFGLKRQQNLVVVEAQPEIEEEQQEKVYRPKRRKGPDKKFRRSNDGEGTLMIRKPVDLNKIRNIQHVDTGEYKNETKEFTEKVKFSVSERRPPIQYREKECHCGRVEDIHPELDRDGWECSRCLKAKARGRK